MFEKKSSSDYKMFLYSEITVLSALLGCWSQTLEVCEGVFLKIYRINGSAFVITIYIANEWVFISSKDKNWW